MGKWKNYKIEELKLYLFLCLSISIESAKQLPGLQIGIKPLQNRVSLQLGKET